MLVRPSALATFVCLALATACSKAPPKDEPAPAPKREASPRPEPKRGPCAADTDCRTYLDPCSCGCLAVTELPPPVPNADWATMCEGNAPGNCGVASPCMNVKAACDLASKTCRAVR